MIFPSTCQKEKAVHNQPPLVITSFGHCPYVSTRCSKKALVLPSSLTKKLKVNHLQDAGIQGHINPSFLSPTFTHVSSTTMELPRLSGHL